MRIWHLMSGLKPRKWFRLMGKSLAYGVSAALLTVSPCGLAIAQTGPLVLQRSGRTISLVPYAPNILRSNDEHEQDCCDRARDTGLSRSPSAQGWTHERDAKAYDVYRSREWWSAWRPAICPKTSCRSRCRSMR